jgi:hypothetical protein
MPVNPNDFWDEWPPVGDERRLPDLTSEMVARAEAYFSIMLPASYIDLLKVKNGGRTKGFVLPMRNAPPAVGDCLELDYLHGIGVVQPEPPDFWGWDGSQNIYMSPYMSEEWGLPEQQILISGDGHTWISLDYRHGATPVVT